MKYRKQLAAGIMGMAVLLQNAGMLPLLPAAPALTASAYTMLSNEPRTYQYDFNTFQAQYDVRKKQWYTMEGDLMRAETEAVQQMTAAEDSTLKLRFDFSEKTAAVSKGGETSDCSELFREMFFEQLERIRPEYEKERVYDKATQRYIPLPEPENFPLSYTCGEQFRNSAPAGLSCGIRFGKYEFGTFGISMSGDLFSEGPNGTVRFDTASKLRARATVSPGSYAGDVNYDRSVDIADAVLACRVIAEDITARVTDIGRALADQNCDDRIDASDINDILYDVACVPYSLRVPTGTVPVVSARVCTPAEFDALFGMESIMKSGLFRHQETGEQYDTWYFAEVNRNSEQTAFASYQFAVRTLTLDAEGSLQIGIDSTDFSDHWGYAMVAVTVPHNALPSDTGCTFIPEKVRSLSPYLPSVRFITVAPLPENSIKVLQLETVAQAHTPEQFDELAQRLGYADGNALDAYAAEQNTDCFGLQHCTPGEAVDVWDLAFFLFDNADMPFLDAVDPDGCRIDDLFLWNSGTLGVWPALRMRPAWSAQFREGYIWVWFRLTVPHGTIPDQTQVRFYTGRHIYDDTYPGVRYIRKETLLEEPDGVHCWDYFNSGLREGDEVVPEEIRNELDAAETRYTYRLYTEAEQMPETERLENFDFQKSDLLTVYIRTDADENGGFFNEFSSESGVITVDGILHLKAAEYRSPAEPGIPTHYDRLVLIVPKNLLKDITGLRLETDPYYDSIRQCVSDSAEKPGEQAVQGSDGRWYWHEEIRVKDKYLAAAKPDEWFVISGSVPEKYTELHADVEISVVDAMTGAALPGFTLILTGNNASYFPGSGTTDLDTVWETTAENPVNRLSLSAVRINYGEQKDGPDYTVRIRSLADHYCADITEKSFDLPDDGSLQKIVLYAFPADRDDNVHFIVRDRSCKEDNPDFFTEIYVRAVLCISDQAGTQLYRSSFWEEFDCLLPDGAYTAKLEYIGVRYAFADPESPLLKTMYSDAELRQFQCSDTIRFTVTNGVPDLPEYSFDMMKNG